MLGDFNGYVGVKRDGYECILGSFCDEWIWHKGGMLVCLKLCFQNQTTHKINHNYSIFILLSIHVDFFATKHIYTYYFLVVTR